MTHALDLLTRAWWRRVGRRVDLGGEHSWLDAPTSRGSGVADGWLADAAGVPIHEEFHVFVDDEGVLRTDHDLRLWSAEVVRLHDKLEPRSARGPRGRAPS